MTDTATHPTPDVDLNDAGNLVLQTRDGPVEVRAARAFPWSHPDRFIALRDDDGKELATIENLAALPARSRGAVEAWLQRHTFVPKVLRVLEVREVNAAWLFRFETDRGDATVLLKEREDLRFLDDGRMLLRDPDGQTYELPIADELDPASQRELERIV